MTRWREALFAPRRVALVGASATPGKLGHLFMQNLLAPGFDGEVIAVHPTLKEILGRPAYANVAQVPGPVDLAVIVAPSGEVAQVIDDCAGARVPVAVVISGGFAETGAAGRALQEDIVARARAGDVRVIGPNCFGVVDTSTGLNASLGFGLPTHGGIALYTQSGAYGMAAFTRSQEDLIGFSKVVACGNKADLDETDMLCAFADDPDTSVIAMLLESISDGRRFFEAARAIAPRKPIVILKTGSGEAARRAAASHTAALATNPAVARAALRQAQVRVVNDGLTLFDVAAALARQPPLPGRRIAVITNSGGTGVEIADLADAHGLALPQLSPSLQAALSPELPAHASVLNPIDVTTAWHRFPQMYGACLESLLAGDEVDGVMPVLLQRSALMPEVTDKIIETLKAARARGCRKPVHIAWVGSAAAAENRRRLLAAGIPCHDGAARTVRVLAATAPPAASHAPERPVAEAPTAPSGTWLPADAAFKQLQGAGLPVAPWRPVTSRAEAIAAAKELSLPVVLKAEQPGLIHKSDRGGVHLDLATPEAVGNAYDDVARRLGSTAAVVQAQVPRGVEIVLGARRDATFGPVIMAGLGGIFVEVLGDIALRLAPFEADEALAMLGELKGNALLAGSRGRPPVDRPALARLITKFAKWVAGAEWLEELDANPLIAHAHGFTIVDARMRVSAPPPAV